MEKLAHLIQNEVKEGNWLPFQLKKNGTKISHLFFADDLILFAEANMEQAGLIKACLDDFCLASREKVNEANSRIYFSSNVHHNRKQEISSFLGFTPTEDLGKYLGVPLNHQKATKNTYQYVLDKMDRRLSGWKASTLSMAGRHTLISSVVAAIPQYTMQTVPLPLQISDETDKRCRGFLWGSTSASKKIHLVAWDDICRRKDEGGLGLRHARKQNKAYMMKLGWALMKRKDALWVKFLSEKYKCGGDVVPRVERKKKESQAWKGIHQSWNETMRGWSGSWGVGHKYAFGKITDYQTTTSYSIMQ